MIDLFLPDDQTLAETQTPLWSFVCRDRDLEAGSPLAVIELCPPLTSLTARTEQRSQGILVQPEGNQTARGKELVWSSEDLAKARNIPTFVTLQKSFTLTNPF